MTRGQPHIRGPGQGKSISDTKRISPSIAQLHLILHRDKYRKYNKSHVQYHNPKRKAQRFYDDFQMLIKLLKIFNLHSVATLCDQLVRF